MVGGAAVAVAEEAGCERSRAAVRRVDVRMVVGDVAGEVRIGVGRIRQIHELSHIWLSQNSYGTGIAVQIG